MNTTKSLDQPTGNPATVVGQIIAWLESVSYDTLIATPARIFIAATFWLSGRTKVDGLLSINQSAFFLFENEYALPVIPSRLAAHLATYAEHLFPLLLIVGFASRLSASALLLMTLVIQVFVYPDAWRTHLLWASALAFLVFRGPGALSVDHFLRRRYENRKARGVR
ncbi:MAG: DoxX family protein [Gammaproteobacteria bacterium]|nr:DoxX family protein [Gammaproteobacteria bacterium]